MAIDIIPFDGDEDRWNSFIKESVNGTLFHRLDFLSYTEKTFDACHFIIKHGRERIGVIPGALLHDGGVLSFRSPYSASYGGFVFKEPPPLELVSEIVELFLREMKERNIRHIVLSPAPYHYGSVSMDVLDYCLLANGFHCANADLTSAVRVDGFNSAENMLLSFHENARRNIKKAEQESFIVEESNEAQAFYPLVSENAERVKYSPAHSMKELERIFELVPENVKLFLARRDKEIAGGIMIFLCTRKTALAFYICIREEFKKAGITGLLYEHVLRWAWENKFSWVDFGTSTLKMKPNFGLARFKEGFGARHFLRKTFEKRLDV